MHEWVKPCHTPPFSINRLSVLGSQDVGSDMVRWRARNLLLLFLVALFLVFLLRSLLGHWVLLSVI